MFWYNLILSDKYRLARHLAFWLVRWVLFFVYLRLNAVTMSGEAFTEGLAKTMKGTAVNCLLDAALCYATIYWLLPAYFIKRRYLAFGAGIALLCIAHLILFSYFFEWYLGKPNWIVSLDTLIHMSRPFFLFGTFPICLLLVTYKLLKIGYMKEEEKTALTIGNTNAELLLLKAQVHPHFLFNTLNNIYSFALDKSPLAAGLVEKLSNLIRYMAKECDAPLVPLFRELEMLSDYIGLEKVRYGDRLKLQFNIEGDPDGKQIAPLLMIPFVENCFKHGASKMLEHPWVNLNISVEESALQFSLSNSKLSVAGYTNGKGGLGLKNVRRRLQLLYPAKHHLDINSGDDSYSVNLLVELVTNPAQIEDPRDMHETTLSTIHAN